MDLMRGSDLMPAMKEQEKVPGKETVNDLSLSMVDSKPIDQEKESFINEHKTEVNDDDISMFPRPKKGCKFCNESGSEGWNTKTEEIVLCRCIKNRIMKVFDQDKLMTYGEIKEMYNKPRRLRGLPDIDHKMEN